MSEQSAFDFSAPPASPEIGEVERLLAWLSAHPGFHTAASLADALDLSDRKVRQIAEQNRNLIVSGPGSPGYCHLYHCPSEQIHHYTEQMISQGKKMIRNALITRRAAHAIIR